MVVERVMQSPPDAPKSIEELVELAENGTIPTEKNGTITPIAVNSETYRKIKTLSAASGISIGRLIAMAVHGWLAYPLEQIARSNE